MHFYHVSDISLGTEYTQIRDNQPSRTSPYSINNTAITAQCDKGTIGEGNASYRRNTEGGTAAINLRAEGIGMPGREISIRRTRQERM